MKLQIFSFSWKSFASDSVVSATLMTTTWEITILDNHSPLLSIWITEKKKKKISLYEDE